MRDMLTVGITGITRESSAGPLPFGGALSAKKTGAKAPVRWVCDGLDWCDRLAGLP